MRAVAPLMAAAAAVCAVTGAGAAEIVLELKQEALLAGPVIRLSDVAQVQAPAMQLQSALENLQLGRAPLAGYLEQRSRAELDALLKSRVELRGHVVTWQGATSIKLRTESVTLSGTQVTEAAEAYLRSAFGAKYERLDIQPAAPVADVPAPAGALQLRARPVDRLRSRTVVWIDVLAGGVVCRSVMAPLTVSAWRQAPVAMSAIAEGAALDGVAWQLTDVAALADEPADAAALNGARMRQRAEPGQVVLRRQLAQAGMVMRGERVRLQTGGPGLQVETSAVAEADAVQGQAVKVRTGKDGAVVTATVAGPGVVRIDGI